MVFFFRTAVISAAEAPKIDPIRFEIKTEAGQVTVDEEFEITISAQLMNIPANTAYIFENSNSFRLKVVFPDGFRQTGGTYSDFVGAELTSSQRSVSFSVKGKFVTSAPKGVFQLLRSHKNATNQSNFVAVGQLSFDIDEGDNSAATARINLETTPSYVKYMSIAQLRAGSADTTSVVFITDKPKDGLFRYNASSTATDDEAMTIITNNGRRYERVYEGIVNVNWFGVVADGSTDQTSKLQALLNNPKFPVLYFPYASSSYRIGAIRIPSNKTLNFEDNTVVEGLGKLGTYDPMVYMIEVGNIVIEGKNVTFKDHRENYTSGQQRHVFLMQGVKNVIIDGISANSGGGDGFYIGGSSVVKFSENVTLNNIKADNNRRQGISIISGRNILIQNALLTNTNGEAPGAGIDIEPNSSSHILENIKIINPTTKNNAGAGIQISPWALSGTDKTIDILVDNHSDYGSFYGFWNSTVTSSLKGSVTVKNAIWENNKVAAYCARNWSSRGPVIHLVNPTVINANSTGSTSPNLGAAFLIYKAAGDGGDPNIGNVHIFYPTIQDTRPTQLITSSFCYRDIATGARIINCTLTDPIIAPNSLTNKFLIVHNTELAMSDKQGYFMTDFGDYTRYAGYMTYGSIYHNQSSKATRLLKLEKVNPNFPEVTVEIRAPYPVRILPFSTDNILPVSAVNGKYITSSTIGSRIVLKKTTDNSWYIKSMIGTWSVEP